MVMRKASFRKNLLREIKNSKSRFLSIFVIVAIGVAFFAGVRATSPDMILTCDKYLKDNNFSDLTILSPVGFVDTDIENIKSLKGVSEVIPGYGFDAMAVNGRSEKPVKVHSFKIGDQRSNKPVLVEGSLPRSEDECVTEETFLQSEHLKIGDYIELKTLSDTKKFKIVGTVNSPLYISNYDRGNNSLGNGKTTAFFQIGEKSSEKLSLPTQDGDKNKVYSELSVMVKGARDKNIFMDEYKDLVQPVKDKIQGLGKESKSKTWYVLDSSNNEGIIGFKNNADRIGAIGKVFPLFFFLIATLVCLTSMTRMVEEHRTQIGTFKALGYSKLTIISEYFLYSFGASMIGSIVGVLVGFNLFPSIIFNAYRIMYSLPPVVSAFDVNIAITSTIVAVLCTTLAAVLACIKELIAVPADLMRPKAPRAGKRILLERIVFIWKRMSFIQKVTARNILRYKKRFFMTTIGIAGCTALLLTGFGLKDSILSITEKQFNDIYSYNMMSYFSGPIASGEANDFRNGLKQYNEIDSSLLLLQQSVSVKNDSKKNIGSVYLMVPENNESLKNFIHLKFKGEDIPIADDGVVITEKLSKLLNVNKGDNIEITLGEKNIKAKILDITQQYVGHYIYMSPKYYEKLFEVNVKYNAFASIIKNTNKALEDKLSTDLMKAKNINSVNFTTSISENFKKSMKGMDSVIWVLIISAAALAFVVMFNLTSININERIRELATIKVLGFYDKEVAAYIFRENMVLSIIGTLVGLILGLGLHRYVVVTSEIEMIMFVRAIKPISFIYSAVLTIIFSALVNVVMYSRIKKINMVESLKSAE
jgi:putative ABC transport system permease protein